MEVAWHYRHYYPASKALRTRREGTSQTLIAHAARAERRLSCKFYRMVEQRKRPQIVVTAIARGLAGFIWGAMVGRLDAKEA